MLGRTHPLVQRVRNLRRERRAREDEGVFLAEGTHLAQEALLSGADIEHALYSAAARASREGEQVLSLLEQAGVPRDEVSERVLDLLQDARSPQPFVLVVKRSPLTLDAALVPRSRTPLIVVAHSVQDPGNLGAILRSADAAGATLLVASGSGADLHHPRAVRATMGSIFRLPAVTAGLDVVVPALARCGIRCYATGAEQAVDYDRCDLRVPVALVLGGEGRGLPADLAGVESGLRIPMRAGVESLSVAAAAAVLLFEAARQRSRNPFTPAPPEAG